MYIPRGSRSQFKTSSEWWKRSLVSLARNVVCRACGGFKLHRIIISQKSCRISGFWYVGLGEMQRKCLTSGYSTNIISLLTTFEFPDPTIVGGSSSIANPWICSCKWYEGRSIMGSDWSHMQTRTSSWSPSWTTWECKDYTTYGKWSATKKTMVNSTDLETYHLCWQI